MATFWVRILFLGIFSPQKTGRYFVKAMSKDVDDKFIISTVLAMAHKLRVRVVAKGIEDAETLWMLHEMGCDTGQGQLFLDFEYAFLEYVEIFS